MSDILSQIIIVSIMGGWCIVFAFGSKIQDWYEIKKQKMEGMK